MISISFDYFIFINNIHEKKTQIKYVLTHDIKIQFMTSIYTDFCQPHLWVKC